MIKIKRFMTKVDQFVDTDLSTKCQASFNSDGNITLRKYNHNNPSNDEIIILSSVETEALFKLFSKIGQKIKNYDLPF